MKKKAIICDLDMTLTNPAHRAHLVEGKDKDWKTFFELCLEDSINQWCLRLVEAMQKHEDCEIIFITGRPDVVADQTIAWIKKNTKFSAELGVNLFMRKNKNFKKDFVIKEEIYLKCIEPFYEVILAIDDKKEIVQMFRNHNVPALYCGNFE